MYLIIKQRIVLYLRPNASLFSFLLLHILNYKGCSEACTNAGDNPIKWLHNEQNYLPLHYLYLVQTVYCNELYWYKISGRNLWQFMSFIGLARDVKCPKQMNALDLSSIKDKWVKIKPHYGHLLIVGLKYHLFHSDDAQKNLISH